MGACSGANFYCLMLISLIFFSSFTSDGELATYFFGMRIPSRSGGNSILFVKEIVTYPVFEICVTLTSGGNIPFLTPVADYIAFFLARSRFNKS